MSQSLSRKAKPSFDELLSCYQDRAKSLPDSHRSKLTNASKTAATVLAFSAGVMSTSDQANGAVINSGISNAVASVVGSGSASLAVDLNNDGINDGYFRLNLRSESSSAVASASFDSVGKKKKKVSKNTGPRGVIATSSAGYLANAAPGFRVDYPLTSGYFQDFAQGIGLSAQIFPDIELVDEDGKKKKKVVKKTTTNTKKKKKVPTKGGIPPHRSFLSNSTGYAGIAFLNSSSETVFGWLKLRFDFEPGLVIETSSLSVTVFEAFYEDSGSAAVIGSVPEPTTATGMLGLLAMGSLGLREMRQRKR